MAPAQLSRRTRLRQRSAFATACNSRLFSVSTSRDENAETLNQSIEYSIASANLAATWLDLVQKEQVAVTTTMPDETTDNDDSNSIGVRYGVRLRPNTSSNKQKPSFMEFVEPIDVTGEVHPKIASINATLCEASQSGPTTTTGDSTRRSLLFQNDGAFVAQLQLVRTLRPPPSPGFGVTDDDFRTTSTPPAYNAERDSFVTGPLRLELRPLVAQLQIDNNILNTDWDVFHNISPADVRGHFLLVPTLEDPQKNWRGQALIESDCHDLIHLVASTKPIGSLLVCFNSVGAGASQNHIHCHVWPSPPVPLLAINPPAPHSTHDDDHDHEKKPAEDYKKGRTCDSHREVEEEAAINGWSCYSAMKVESIYDFLDIQDEDGNKLVEISYLEYPCFCVQLSSVSTSSKPDDAAYKALGKALWTVLQSLGDAPHNVCMVNRPSFAEEDGGITSELVDVDVYVFARSRERSPNVVPASKLGASEMMGVFHCQSKDQLQELVASSEPAPMVQALQDVTHENAELLWEIIEENLVTMD